MEFKEASAVKDTVGNNKPPNRSEEPPIEYLDEETFVEETFVENPPVDYQQQNVSLKQDVPTMEETPKNPSSECPTDFFFPSTSHSTLNNVFVNVIRPGMKKTKVLKKDKEALIRYSFIKGVADGRSYDEIEAALKTLKAKIGRESYVIYPSNFKFFRICRADIVDTAMYEALTKKIFYHKIKLDEKELGEGTYSYFKNQSLTELVSPLAEKIPIVFSTNNINSVFQRSFLQYSASSLIKWTEPCEDGSLDLYQFQNNTNNTRLFRSRKKEKIGKFDPATNTDFQAGKMNFQCKLFFAIPVTESNLCLSQMSFGSVYAHDNIGDTLEQAKSMFGKINGLINNNHIFEIIKTYKEVPVYDKKSKKVFRKGHWIINLKLNDILANLRASQNTDVKEIASAERKQIAASHE